MSKSRLSLLMAACLVCGGALLTRAFFIQLMPNTRLAAMAKKQFQSKFLVRPRRGIIMDRNGEPLAINMETQSLAANPTKITHKKPLARTLARSIGMPYEKILERLNEKREFVWIKRQVSDQELEQLRKNNILNRTGDLVEGFWLIKESKRVYPQGELAAHILGDVNVDSDGIEGVELWANESLRGKVVSVNAIRDAWGRPAFMDAVTAREIQDGEPIGLTLDSSLQFSAERELQHAVYKTQSKGGTVMVMNATNGEILAMANAPTFNPNLKSAAADHRRNRALTDGYEPGSTFKAILLATALARGWKLSDQLWAEQGSVTIQGHKISEAETHEKFEWLSLKNMIQVSSNVAAAKLAIKIGADSFYHSVMHFGFGTRSGVGFPGEIPGRIPPQKNWQPLALANIGFGHGVLVTPIQMLRAYAVFLNGGWLVQPTLIKSGIANLKNEPPKRIISQKIADQVTTALKSVTVEGGTGMKAALEGYTVAGKTGTAQMVDAHTGKYSRSRYVASFIGYATDVERMLVIFAMLQEPRGIYYASETAAPLFRNVLEAAASRFSLPAKISAPAVLAQKQQPELSESATIEDTIRQSAAAPTAVQPAPAPGSAHVEWAGTQSDGKTSWRIPSFKGLTSREVIQQLKKHSFQLEMQGDGVVMHQQPLPGQILHEGSKIRLTLGDP